MEYCFSHNFATFAVWKWFSSLPVGWWAPITYVCSRAYYIEPGTLANRNNWGDCHILIHNKWIKYDDIKNIIIPLCSPSEQQHARRGQHKINITFHAINFSMKMKLLGLQRQMNEWCAQYISTRVQAAFPPYFLRQNQNWKHR